MILDSMLYKPSFNYLKKEPFTGSYCGMRYRIYQKTETNEEGKTKPVALLAAVYPDEFCFEKTFEENKTISEFAFSDQGLTDALDWISKMQEEKFS